MKDIFKLLLLLVTFGGYSQANLPKQAELPVNENTISGKWIFHDVINDKTPEENAETKELLEGTSVEFRADKTYIFEFIVQLEGTWSLDTTTNIIKTNTRRRKDHTWKIHHVYKDYIVMSRNDATQQIIFKAER